jgi:AraC family transcriptional regulator
MHASIYSGEVSIAPGSPQLPPGDQTDLTPASTERTMKMDLSLANMQYAAGAPKLVRRPQESVKRIQRAAAEAEPSDLPRSKPYAAVLARLLEAADGALARDPGSAKDCIALLEPSINADGRPSAILKSARTKGACGGLAPWQARRLVDHVEANCTEKLRSGDLARIAKLSIGYFIRAFKVTFGETPHAYVIRCRIVKAEAMMLETDWPLGQIGVACGFSDQAHFSRRFREMAGTSPQRWRSVRQGAPADDAQVLQVNA